VYPLDNITGLQLDMGIADKHSNSLVLLGTLQEGYKISPFGFGGIWHFDENSGNIAHDSSGNLNHGIITDENWTTDEDARNGSALSFNGFTNYVNVPNRISLDIQEDISMEAWIKPKETGLLIGYEKFSNKFGFHPDIIHVNEDIYAIVSEKQSNEVSLITLNVTQNGVIDFPEGDQYNQIIGGSKARTSKPNIKKTAENIFLVSYIEDNVTLALKTFYINPNLTIEETGFARYLDSKCSDSYLLNINQDIIGVIYCRNNTGNSGNNDGILRLLNITDTGQIKIVSNESFDDADWFEPKIYQIYDDLFTISYTVDDEAYLETITIEDSLNIEKTSTIPFPINSDDSHDPFLIQIKDNLSTVLYGSNSLDGGFAKSIFIESNGSIKDSGVDTFQISDYDLDSSPHGLLVSDEIIFYTFSINNDKEGYVASIRIVENGTISVAKEKTPYEKDKCITPQVFYVSDVIYGVVYEGKGDHPGVIKTFFMEPDPEDMYMRVLGKKGSYGFNVNTTTVFVTLNGELFSAPLSISSVDDGWYHVVVTCDQNDLTIYANNVSIYTEPLDDAPITIKKTDSPLLFGKGFYGIVDEVGLYGRVLSRDEISTHFEHPGSIS
jgi:hypothetical protein